MVLLVVIPRPRDPFGHVGLWEGVVQRLAVSERTGTPDGCSYSWSLGVTGAVGAIAQNTTAKKEQPTVKCRQQSESIGGRGRRGGEQRSCRVHYARARVWRGISRSLAFAHPPNGDGAQPRQRRVSNNQPVQTTNSKQTTTIRERSSSNAQHNARAHAAQTSEGATNSSPRPTPKVNKAQTQSKDSTAQHSTAANQSKQPSNKHRQQLT